MAEALAAVGIVANFAGVIGAGIALSTTLYDFAHVLGSAADDVKSLATDLSIFCAVLRQVQSTLGQARAYRLSMSAIDTTQAVIDRCKVIFDDLDAAITKLQGGKSKPDFMTRVKWYFKEKRILLIHEQLKACAAQLHLMLTLLQLAQKIASSRNTSLYQNDQDDQDRLMTHSLFRAQQAAIEDLARAEYQHIDEDINGQSDFRDQTPTHSPHSGDGAPSHRRNRSSQIINGTVRNGQILPATRVRPVSIVLAQHMNRLSVVGSVRYSHLPALDDRRLSILQTDELLREWTDQRDPLVDHESDPGHDTTDSWEPDRTSSLSLTYDEARPTTPYATSSVPNTTTSFGDLSLKEISDPPSIVPHIPKLGRTPPPKLTLPDSYADFSQGQRGRRVPPPKLHVPDFKHESVPSLVTPNSTSRTWVHQQDPARPTAQLAVLPRIEISQEIHQRTAQSPESHQRNISGRSKKSGRQEMRERTDPGPISRPRSADGETPVSDYSFSQLSIPSPGDFSLSSLDQTIAQLPSEQGISEPAEADSPKPSVTGSIRVQIDDRVVLVKSPHKEATCRAVIPMALSAVGVTGDWRDWALRILHNDGVLEIGPDSVPHLFFTRLEGQGKMPVLLLRKRHEPLTWSHAVMDEYGTLPASKSRPGGMSPRKLISNIGTEFGIEAQDAKPSPGAQPTSNSAETIALAESESKDSVEIHKNIRVNLNDDCSVVLPMALRKYNITADWRLYALYIDYIEGGLKIERFVEMEDKPLHLFKQFDQEGKKPVFRLTKLRSPTAAAD